jgi:hypothetical protein
MSKVWTPKDAETLQTWIDTIQNEASDELTSWEVGFIESVQQSLNRYGKLSQRQEDMLERIYAEKTK